MQFCMRIAKHLLLKEVKENIDKNLVLSPISINVVLNMVAAGSTGQTLKHLLGLLGFKSINETNSNSSEIMAAAVGADNGEDGPVLSMVNGVWADLDFPLKPCYEEVLRDIFDCEAKNVDFKTQAEEVRREVNIWAKEASRGLITNILEPGSLNSSTILVLANGLYFKGTWSDKFDAERTEDRQFYLLNGDTVSVPFMTSLEDYQFGSFDGFKALKIPYQTGKSLDDTQFSMYFFLPNELNGLQNLLEKFNSDPEFLNLKLREEQFDKFWIPKFKFSYGFDVCKTMEEMGVSLQPAEFDEEIFVSNIFHKAFVEIHEEGTEAAAITVSSLCGCSMYMPVKEQSFVADHPFMFMIKEEISGLVFFTGTVLNPIV